MKRHIYDTEKLHVIHRFPFNSHMYVRAFRGPVGACVWMCLGVAKTAGTPTAVVRARFSIDSLITIRYWCWNTHRPNPIVSLVNMSRTGFLPAN